MLRVRVVRDTKDVFPFPPQVHCTRFLYVIILNSSYVLELYWYGH